MKKDPSKPKSKLEAALALQLNDNIDGAMDLLKEVLSDDPKQPDALHAMGLLYAQKKDFVLAIHYLEEALHVSPGIAEFHNNLANAYKAAGKVQGAMRHYFEALRLKTNYPQAHNNLGALLYRLGNFEEASSHFQKALRMDPLAVDTHYNLANCYVQLDRMLDAAVHFEEVLKLRPNHLGALHNLGITLCFLKRFEKAQPLLEQVLTREPQNIDALFHLGVIASSLAKATEAKKYYESVLALNPNHEHSHHNLATIYLHLKEPNKALLHYQAALKLQPDNKTAQHMIDALTGKTQEAGAPFEYTRALFDQYAYTYNQHVKSGLKYQVPTLMRAQLSPLITQMKHEPWDILDLGCGTGLCAPLFSDVSGKITGIDVSPNMIELARQLGGYAELHAIDAISYLKNHRNQFNLIISADVFVYFGSLEEIFELCFAALKSIGLFSFSIEKLEDSEIHDNTHHGFQLRKSGRYAHHPRYIHDLANKHHFSIESESTETIREQENNPVMGNIYVLKKNRS